MAKPTPFLPGDKITVYNEQKVELGEGTLLRVENIPGMKMTAYECSEHTILAKSTHFVRRGQEWIKVALDDLP